MEKTSPITTIEPGLTVKGLAQRLNTDYQTAYRWAALNGYKVTLSPRGKKPFPIPPRGNIPEGLPLIDLCRTLNIDYYQAKRWVKYHGYITLDGRMGRSGARGRTGLEKEELIEFLKQNSNLTLEAVGRKMGVTRERIRQLYQLYKVARTNQVKRGIRVKLADRNEVIDLIRKGSTTPQIAKKLGMNPSTLTMQMYKYLDIRYHDHTPAAFYEKQGLILCGRCVEPKPKTEFYSTTRGRVSSYCKPCHREYYAMKNRNKGLDRNRAKPA